jgi:hypothetical protein
MARMKLADKEHRLRSEPQILAVDYPHWGDHRMLTPAVLEHPFSLDPYSNTPTFQYLTVRLYLATRLLPRAGTLDSVQEAFEHLREVISQHPTDHLKLRHSLPSIMLRLDLDQECYDFIKGWAGHEAHMNGNGPHLGMYPHLSLNGADALENVDFLDTTASHHVIAALLLKLKLLMDIRDLKVMRKVISRLRVTTELRKNFESAVIRSPLSTRFLGQPPELLAQTEKTLLRQIRELGATLNHWSPHYIEGIFAPETDLLADTSPGLLAAHVDVFFDEVPLAMQYSYAAWWETEGLLDLVSDARACAERDLEHGVADRLEEVKKMMAEGFPAPDMNTIAQEMLEAGMTEAHLAGALTMPMPMPPMHMGNQMMQDYIMLMEAHATMPGQDNATLMEGLNQWQGMTGEEDDSSQFGHQNSLHTYEIQMQGFRRIWDYLSWAVDNASWLGPWSDRPSERRTRAAEAARRRAKEEQAGNDNASVEEEWVDD